MSGCVYVIHALTTDYYKIGITEDIAKRLRGLQLAIPFWELELLTTHYHDKFKKIERSLHDIYKGKNLRNSEWFELTSDDLSTALMSTVDLADSLGIHGPCPVVDEQGANYITKKCPGCGHEFRVPK